jgi:hypothetical protein
MAGLRLLHLQPHLEHLEAAERGFRELKAVGTGETAQFFENSMV